MTFDEYQKQTVTFELMTRAQDMKAHEPAMVAKLLGLVGEAGEVAEKFKKIVRDREGVITDNDKKDIAKELGDVLWYVSVVADYLGIALEEVAAGNLEKLTGRKLRNVQQGSGDNR